MRRFWLPGALVVLTLAAAGCGVTLFSAPALVSPADGSTVACAATGTYLFTWGKVPNATGYLFEVWTAGTSPVRLIAASTTDTSYAATGAALACDASYKWRVGAAFASSPTVWSGYWTFTIAPAP